MKRRRIAASILCGVSLFLIACSGATVPPAPPPENVVVGLPEASENDNENGVEQFLRLLTFESLTNNGSDGRPVPRLAERWVWEKEDKRLRVFLRPNVSLHDGRSFEGETAAALVRSAVTNPGNIANFRALADVVRVSAEGRELIFDLSRPSATLPEALTVPLDKGDSAVGTGPYVVTEQTKTTATLEAFQRYYQGKPTIQRVSVKVFTTVRAAWAAVLRGELDVVYDVPADRIEFVRNDDIDVVSVPRWYQHVLTLNTNDSRFKSPLVRRALNLAVNREAIIKKVLHGAGEPAGGPIYPRYWSFDSNIQNYAFDPSTAAILLDSAGFRMPTKSPDGAAPARLRFTCLLPKDFAVWERIALEVQQNLLNIGVDMQFKVVPMTEFGELVYAKKFEAAFINMISGPTPTRASIWWGSAKAFKTRNVFGYANPDVDHEFDMLLRSTNDAVVRTSTSRLQRIFHDDPPALFIAWDARARAISRRFIVPDDSRDPMWTLWKWTEASSRKVAEAR